MRQRKSPPSRGLGLADTVPLKARKVMTEILSRKQFEVTQLIKSSEKATLGDPGRPPPGGDPKLGSDGEKGAGGKECQAEGTGHAQAQGRNKLATLRNRKEVSVARGV